MIVDANVLVTIYVLFMIMYSICFVEHASAVKIFLSIVTVICVRSIVQSYNKSQMYTKKQVHQANIIGHEFKWLPRDHQMLSMCSSLASLKKHDVQKFTNICTKSDEFLKVYYKELLNKERNMYNNVRYQRYTIQKLDDIRSELLDELYSICFVSSYTKYTHVWNVPELIKRLDESLTYKINLIKFKRGFQTS
jgi:hypothetical protein